MFRFLVLVCLLVMSMGCSTLPAEIATGVPPSTEKKLSVIGQTPIGGSFVLDQGMFQVIDEYTAASGRVCRSLLDQRAGSTRVACRGRTNQWYLRHALTSNTAVKNTKMPLSVDSQNSAASESAGEAVKPPVQTVDNVELSNQNLLRVAFVENETLWRFAKRVTGNALNWQAIASLNGISDVNSLRAGQLLSIPSQFEVLARAQGSVSAGETVKVAAQLPAKGS